MKKLKNIKKILILLLAIVTVFSISGVTSYAETKPFGGIDVDLDSSLQELDGPSDDFLNAFVSEEVALTTTSSNVRIYINNGTIYGTPEQGIKAIYESNIKLTHATNLTFDFGSQLERNLNEYTFVNKVPESINVPVPFYFEEGEKDPTGWIFEGSPKEGYTNTAVNVASLRTYFNSMDVLTKGYTFKSDSFLYTPQTGYTSSNGERRYTTNNAAWQFSVPMNVKYTVDIKPITAGGTPTIGGNNTPVDVPKISEVNKEFFRNGNINTYENDYTAPEGTTDQALLNYGDSYNVATNPIDESIVVMSTNATVADPLTGEGNQATDIGTVSGQTSIEVAYGKNIVFTKVDEHDKPVADAEFTVYDNGNAIGSATSGSDGKVNLPTLRMPKVGENATYTMRETITPEGYVENDAVYTITIDDEGNATITGDGAENGKIVNLKPLSISKTSNPNSGEYVKKGQKIDYILTIENTFSKLRDIVVTDELPEGVVYDTSQPYRIYDKDNNLIATGSHWNESWTGQIAAATKINGDDGEDIYINGKLTIIIPTVVTKEYDPVNMEENIITNQANLKAKKITGNTEEYEDTQYTQEVTHYITPKVSYTMNKVRVTEPKEGLKGFVAGADEKIKYEVTFENTGDLDLNINLNDVFENANYFTFVGDSTANITLEKGKTKTVTFIATVNEGTPSNIDKGYLNTVTSEGTATYTDPESGNDVTIDKTTQKDLEQTSTANTPVIVVKDPTITKTSDPESGSTVAKGDKITYTLTIENPYDVEREIVVTDNLPDQVKADGKYMVNGVEQDQAWNGSYEGTIEANGELVIEIPVVVVESFDETNSEVNVIGNQASLKAKDVLTGEDGEDTPTEEVTHYITPEVSYTMNKVRVTEPKEGLKGFVAGAGEVIEYKVTFKNTGDLDLNINLNDVFENDDYFTFVEASEASIRLEKGETETVIFKATVNEGTPASDDKGYLNTVTSEGTATYTDPESGNDVTIDKTTQKDLEQTSTANTPVIVVKDPTITKTSDPESGSTVAKGDKITYTLTIENPYDVEREIVVTDNLPDQVKADGKYMVNGVEQDQAWNGSYEGTIEANGELVIEIPVVVVESFDETNSEVNVIGNQASLKAKDVLTGEDGEDTPTEEVTHYITPKVSYTMNKVRVTEPKDGLKGFYAGTGEVIDYKVTLVNTGDITLNIDLEDIFVDSEYFEFVGSNQTNVTIEPGESKEVIFQATINANTPVNADYENIVTSIASGSYVDAETGEVVLVDENNWPDGDTSARLEDNAFTPVIAPGVTPVDPEEPAKPEKPGVDTGDNSSIALFGSLAIVSGLGLILKRKKED